ncbi:MAG TPA: hypothetical protein VJ656_01435 [Pyrinomonadaceae bacterium]|nr:hypothetical protein [Pyrinomonadaceae bacterium]
MQFIEKNSFNLRAAVYSLKKDSTALEFVVFPMIHVGSREYYQEISRRLSTCDLILVEGVKSKKMTILTLSYRFIKKIRRMDLITQHEGIRLDEFRNEIKNADMEGNAFDERWSSLPVALRLQLFLIVPVFVVYLFLFGTRETVADNLAIEDLPSSEEDLSEDESWRRLDSLVVDERDGQLIEHIAKVADERAQTSQRVGILYGAFHMRCVMPFLMQKLNYRVVKADWVKVFDL